MKELKVLSVLILGLVMANQECGSPDPDPVFDYQTEFVDIIVTPDTVAVGDTVLVHAIIEDSLDTRFEFNWDFNNPIPVNGSIQGSMIRWKAEPIAGESGDTVKVSFSVKADNGDETKDPPIKSFIIYIIH